jgi:TPR repeat protein
MQGAPTGITSPASPPQTQQAPAPAPPPAPGSAVAAAPAMQEAPRASPALSPAMTAALLQRGRQMLSVGDISAARRLLERAAAGGSGAAAVALGRTYDPSVLAALGVHGIRPDAVAAAEWYRRGAALGHADATSLLQALSASRAP